MELRQSRLKIDRAASHLVELERILASLALHSFRPQTNRASGERYIRLELLHVDDIAHIMVGEVAYQLRSSLDVAAVALAKANGVFNARNIYFPMCASEREFLLPNGKPQQKMVGQTQGVKDAVRAIAPWPGGNDRLTELNALSNTDKHNELVATVVDIGNLMTFGHSGEAATAASFGARFIAAYLANGSVATHGMGFQLEPNDGDAMEIANVMNRSLGLSIDVVFGSTGLIDGCEVISTLRSMLTSVQDAIARLEAA